MNDGLIGIFCAIALAAGAVWSATTLNHTSQELRETQIKFEAYQDAVKDSR